MVTKYNGMKRAKDWVGKKVSLVRDTKSQLVALPAGYKGKIIRQGGGSLTFVGEPCEHCNVRPIISKLSYFDVELCA